MNELIKNLLMRALPALISLIMCFVFLIPVGHGIINIGNAFGAVSTAGLALIFMFRERFGRLIAVIWSKGAGKILLLCVAAALTGFVIYAAAISAAMNKASKDAPENGKTTLIVLGCKVKNGGPSRMLMYRINAAYDFMKEHPEAVAVVSGGKGSDESISEAQCMKEQLVSRGISADRIYMEDRSVSTEENLKFSAEIIGREDLCRDITIVTDGFHQFRAELLAKKQGMTDPHNVSAETSWWLLPTYWVREWFGVAYYGITGK